MTKRAIIAIIFTIAYIALYAGAGRAAIGVEPTVSELVVKAGEATRNTYTVANGEDFPVHVTVEAEDWYAKRMGIKSKIDLKDWLSVTPLEFDVEAHGSKQVEYTVNPPAGARGEVAAMVFFATTSIGENKMSITSRIGVSIYAAFEGAVEMYCGIRGVKVTRLIRVDEKDKVTDKKVAFIIGLENKGNVHIRPTGNIIITDAKGASERIEIQRNLPIYPGRHETYTVMWDKENVAPGKYKARIVLDYGKIFNITRTAEKTVSFVVRENGKISF